MPGQFSCFSCMVCCLQGQEPGVKLEESMKGISYDAMKLLLRYIYAADFNHFMNSLSIPQIKMVAPLADRFQVQHLKDHCDRVLHGAHAILLAVECMQHGINTLHVIVICRAIVIIKVHTKIVHVLHRASHELHALHGLYAFCAKGR